MNARILHCSDFHATPGFYRWLRVQCKNYGLVVLSGDQLDLLGHHPRLGQVEEVLAEIQAMDAAKLAICSGNHDSLPGASGPLDKASWIRALRSDRIHVDDDLFAYGGVQFRCIGWNASLPVSGEGEVWVYHSPPRSARTALVPGGVSFGCELLDALCASGRGPRLVLSGHVHEAVSWRARVGNTWSLNPRFAGRGAAVPNHNVIDLAHGIATHHAAEGETDIVHLW